MRPNPGITTLIKSQKTRLLLALIILFAILAIIDDYQGWRFLLLALSGAWGLSFTWARSLARTLSLRREMRFGWAQVGDQLEERFSLANTGGFPGLWVEVVDHSDIPDYRVGIATGIDPNSTNSWRTHGICTRRGLFTLGPTTLRTSDPLGLFQVEIHDPRSTTLMVTPPIIPLPQIEVAPGGRAGEGRPLPKAPERTVSVSSVRQFVPGDSLRWIHWRTSARRDEFFVRLFDSTPSGNWWIILDMDEACHVGEASRSTIEHAVMLAASLADRGLRLGRAVGLVAHGKPLVFLPPREGEAQRWEILRGLALVDLAPNPLGEVLIGLRPTLGTYTSLVIITPNTQSEWLEGLLPLHWLGAVPSALLLDPQAFGAPDSLNLRGLVQRFNQWGIYHQVITPDLLDRPEARPGHKGQWKWRISPTGRAIAVNPAQETSWRTLS